MTQDKKNTQNKKELTDILRVEGVNAKGFGIIPKLVMQDRRLTRDAKAIYAYFKSYAGAGNTAFPSIKKICYDLSFGKEETFRKHFNLLKKYNYIQVEQERDTKGKWGRNIYTVIDKPNYIDTKDITENIKTTEFQPSPSNRGYGEQLPYPLFEGDRKNGVPVKGGTNNNNNKNNSNLENNQSVTKEDRPITPQELYEILNKANVNQYKAPAKTLLENTIRNLFYAQQLKIDNTILNNNQIKLHLHKISPNVCDSALWKFSSIKQEGSPIKNSSKYFQALLFNTINEIHADMIF